MTRFSQEKKLQILNHIRKQGLSMVQASKIFKVSRITIYSWEKQFQKFGKLEPRYCRGADHYKSISFWKQQKLWELVNKYPDYSLDQLLFCLRQKQIKISRHGLYNFLKNHRLNRLENRRQIVQKQLPTFYPLKRGQITGSDRLSYIRDILEHKRSIASVSRQLKISRFTLYNWIKKYSLSKNYNGLKPAYKKGLEHYRALPQHQVVKVLDLVAEQPKLSVHKLYTYLSRQNISVGYHGLQSVLERYGLNTAPARLAYAKTNLRNLRPAYVESERRAAVSDSPIPNLMPIPPPWKPAPLKSVTLPDESTIPQPKITSIFFRILKTIFFKFMTLPFRQPTPLRALIIAMVIPSLIMIVFTEFYKYSQLYIHAPKFTTGLGYAFASISLAFGLFFFLYSVKYYLSIIYVLLFTRKGEKFVKNSLQPDLSQMTLERHPFVSIHLPLYNEKRVVNRLLDAALSMDYDNYEVIVCDDSTDETTAIVNEWKNHPRIKISHRDSRAGFKGGALQLALSAMAPQTEFILVFDADFLPYPDTITQFLKYFQASAGTLDFGKVSQVSRVSQVSQVSRASDTSDTHHTPDTHNVSNIAAVQGYQWHVLNKSENWITRGVRNEYAGSYVIERTGAEIYGGLKQIAGSVYMIRSDVLKQYNWGTSITEDFELTLKLYRDGWKVVYTPYVQAPSECVSTLKRLVRQRMRWAEGHSHNIKKHFMELMWGRWVEPISNIKYQISNIQDKISNTEVSVIARNGETKPACAGRQSSSPDEQITAPSSDWVRNDNVRRIFLPSRLTLAEKLEFLYLSPYYLQSFFFLLGTFCWYLSEAVFRVRLPFWTAVWGWSLVLTNMLSLPLMNIVGLFLEEAEEKDYMGLLSFVVLTYILTPFQAYASVKGFIEDKEGPWFRTPKTGRITDIYRKGRFYRWLTGIFGRPEPVVSQTKSVSNFSYLNLTTSNAQFNNFNIKPEKYRFIGNLVVILALIISFVLSYAGNNIKTGSLADLPIQTRVEKTGENNSLINTLSKVFSPQEVLAVTDKTVENVKQMSERKMVTSLSLIIFITLVMFTYLHKKKRRFFKKFVKSALTILLVLSWLLSGWPVIRNNPRLPPKIQEAEAAFDERTETNAQGSSLSSPFQVTLNVPASTADGDIMFTWIGSFSATVTTNGAWTLLGSYTAQTDKYYLFARVASSEPASYVWTFSGTSKYKATCTTYIASSDFDVTDVTTDLTVSNTSYRTSGTPNYNRAASFNVPNANSPIVFFGGVYSTSSRTQTPPTNPGNFAEDYDTGSTTPDFWLEIASYIWSGSGDTGNIDSTISSTGTTKHAFAVALKPPSTFTQSAYRWFANNNSTSVGASIVVQDTAMTNSQTPLQGTAFRLRTLIHVDGAIVAVSGKNFKLQIAAKVGTDCDLDMTTTDESYSDLVQSTGAIRYYNNASPADNAALTADVTNDPGHSGHTKVTQTYKDLDGNDANINFTNSQGAIPVNQDGEWDFTLVDNSATANTTYCLRIVKDTGTTLNTYTVIPEFTTVPENPYLLFGLFPVLLGLLKKIKRKTKTYRS